MNIAILGATSQIAKDLILSASKVGNYAMTLFARRPEDVNIWLSAVGLLNRYKAFNFDSFKSSRHFDGVINFVGVGNPAQATILGSGILDITYFYDSLVLNYLVKNPYCKYIFLSSGAAYGTNFQQPVDQDSQAIININNLQPHDWYGMAKLNAECRHRALPNFSIVDIRVFNYFSHSQDMESRFLITDIVRAIRDDTLLETSSGYMVRDFLNPIDFYQLVTKIFNASPANDQVDCYTLAPVEKLELLDSIASQFGLRYKICSSSRGINATGEKPCYYSLNRSAEKFGYNPKFSSIEGVIHEIDAYTKFMPRR